MLEFATDVPSSLPPSSRLSPELLDACSDAELDSLAFGVVCLDADGTILRYNLYESRFARLDRNQVIGRNFFTEIAPCADLQQFRGRFADGVAAGELHCTFRFHFAFKQRPCDVTVTLFYNSRDKTVWVIVQPFEGKTTAEIWGRR